MLTAKIVAVALSMTTTLALGVGGVVDANREAAAEKAAKSWLALVDKGDYRASWQEAAALFKQAVSAGDWATAVAAARAPLGQVQQRVLKSAHYTTELPGAPDGEYVVLQFETRFANKQRAIETITPMKQADGSWRVSGYFVK